MSDHSHWWALFFGKGEATQAYITEFPCGTEVRDACIGVEIGRIVLENRERFRGEAAGTCRPVEVPHDLEIPDSVKHRLLTEDEAKAILAAGGRPQ